MTRWTQEQDDYLRAHWQEQSDKELAAAVGHPLASTGARRGKLGLCKRKGCRGKDWTQKGVGLHRRGMGRKTIPQIARHLGRSINAVKIKANRLGYAGQMKYGEMMTARKVSELLGVDVHAVCDYWIPKCGLKGRKKADRGKRPLYDHQICRPAGMAGGKPRQMGQPPGGTVRPGDGI